MLQAGIKTLLILRYSNILHQVDRPNLFDSEGFFYVYTFLHIRFWLPVVLNSWDEQLCFSLCGSQ